MERRRLPRTLRLAIAVVVSLALVNASSADVSAAANSPDGMFRDCPECPQMVRVPAGAFAMGAAPGEEEREQLAEAFRHRSQPQRRVHVAPFAVGRFEVTRGEYRLFVQATGRGSDGCFVWSGNEFVFDAAKDWRHPGFEQSDAHPAVCVSWEDANAYVQWLSARTGARYRLLTEAEWEYAARAGSAGARFWGNDAERGCAFANGADLATSGAVPGAADWGRVDCNDRFAFTAPAGQFAANAFGLHDVLGNAAEWTQDCWKGNYAGAPADARAVTDGDCALRAVRGGSWEDAPVGVRSAYRVGSPTTVRVYTRGFRIARDLD